LNVILIAFLQYQQYDVNTWLPLMADLTSRFPALSYYELPTISARSKLEQWWIDEGMRMGIPDPQTRAHTITLYLDKRGFRKALAIEDENEIVILLLDQQGEVLWRATGKWNADLGRGLQAKVEDWFSQ